MLIKNILRSSQPVHLLKCLSQLSQRLFSSLIHHEFVPGKQILNTCNKARFRLLRNSNDDIIKNYRSIHILLKNYLPNSLIKNEEEKLLNGYNKGFQEQHRGYAMRMELTEYGIIWKKPDKVPCWIAEKSGDLEVFEEPDKSLPVVSMLNISSDIAKADEKVQCLLSLDFASEKEVVKMAKYIFKRRVQRHKYDNDSPEVKIAMMTVTIRHLQKEYPTGRKNVRKRVYLKELIEKRRSKLTNLRKMDYKKFEWLLEQLNLVYKPFLALPKISRKASLRRLVEIRCAQIMNDKMEKYRQELEVQKKPFLEEKRKTLKWIAETEERLGLPISVEVPEEEEMKQLTDGGVGSSSKCGSA